MEQNSKIEFKTYPFRWVILAVYFLITIAIEIQWLTFAPIAREARLAYGVSALRIDLLSMIFIGMSLIFCIPASLIIDRFGIRLGVGIGAAFTGFFSLAKGLFADNYGMMLASQAVLGAAQPFILNAVTKVAVKWFPNKERATAVGLGTLAQFVGFIIVNLATGRLIRKAGEAYDLRLMLMTYGIASAIVAAGFLIMIREEPPSPPSEQSKGGRLLSWEGFRHLIKQRDMILVLILFFFGLGMFNAVTTCIDQITQGKGLASDHNGTIMGVMFAAGIAGALVFPPLSDKIQRRKPFLLGAVVLVLPAIAGMTFAHGVGAMIFFGAMLGLFLLGAAGPIGFQYGAEVAYPAPESLSQGIIMLMGQISGILFILGMNLIGIERFMIAFIVLSGANVLLALLLRESPLVTKK